MTSMIARERPLRLVRSRPAAPTAPAPSFEAEVTAFYDRTITAAWRLSLSLYAGDHRRASDAVIEAYRAAWSSGPAGRTQVALLHALVIGSRADHDPVPA